MITSPATARREIPPTRPATGWAVALVLAAGLAATASRANAQTLSWNNASGGSASVPGNWSPSGLPDTSTNLLFNINSALASIPVTFDAASNKSGTMLFRKETYAINITSPHATTTDVTIASASGDNATVVLESGSWSLFNTLGDVRIGNASNTVGVFTIDGPDAEFIGDDGTVLGNVGTGTLNVLDGGRFVTQSMSLGLGNATGSGTVNIDGQALAPTFTRSRLECLQSLVVGSLGTGVLNVTNGAQATCQALFVGTNSTGSGTLTIGGAAISKATLQCTLNTSVGGNSSGIINVNSGGVLDVNAGLTLQGTGVGSGILHVNPGGAAIAGNLIVNAGGSLDLDGGTLDVDGSTFNYNNPASHLVLGAPDAPLLTLKDTVNGTLNVVTGGRALTLGGSPIGAGIADFDVRSGSTLTIPAGDIVMGEQAGDDGGMIVNGAGSALSMAAADRAIVGQSGAGSLRFEAGASAALGGLRIGLNVGSSGSAVFDGAGTMATTNTITIGGDLASSGGTGALTVSGGADVQVASTATTDAVRVWPAGDLSVLGPSILDANKAVRVSGGEVFMDQGAMLAASQFVLETGSDLFINASGTGGPAVIDALASLTGSATIDMKGDLTIGISANPNGFSAAANSTVNLDGNTLTIPRFERRRRRHRQPQHVRRRAERRAHRPQWRLAPQRRLQALRQRHGQGRCARGRLGRHDQPRRQRHDHRGHALQQPPRHHLGLDAAIREWRRVQWRWHDRLPRLCRRALQSPRDRQTSRSATPA
jgi:T5SS/PEP-CTERM-associated repeat protein